MTPISIEKRRVLHVVWRDITDRKKAEDALRTKTEELEGFFASSVDLLCIADTDGYFRRLNREWHNVTGFDLSELEGHRFMDFVHPDDITPTLQIVEKLKLGKEVWNFTNRYRCTDGFYRWLEWQAVSTGNLIYAAARDITERIHTEEALRMSEARLRAIGDNLPGGMIYQLIISPDGSRRFTYISAGVERMHEVTAGEVIKDASVLYNQIPPEDRPGVMLEEDRAVRLMTPFNMETRSCLPSGTIRWMKIASQPRLLPTGEVVFDGVETDITDLKQAEEALRKSEIKYRRLHESMTDAFVRVDMKGCIVEANKSFREMTGYMEKELYHLTYEDLTPKKWHAAEEEITRKQVLARGYSDIYEKEFIRKDGAVFPSELRAFLIRDDKGEAIGRWAIVRDITQRKQTETELQQYREHLEAQVKQRTRELSEANATLIRFRRFAEASGQGFGMATLDGGIVYANATLRNLIGNGNQDENQSLSFLDRYPQEYQRKLQDEIIPLVLKDEQWIGELALITMEGHVIPTIENYFLIRDEAGNPALIADVITDVRDLKQTENELKKYRDQLEDLVTKRTHELQKLNEELHKEIEVRARAEKALRESEQRYRTLFENAPVGISIMKPDHKFDYFNSRFTKMFGYTLRDLPDKDKWFEKAYPDSDYRKEVINFWHKDLDRIEKSTMPAERILKVTTKDGQHKIIHFRTAILENGEHLMSYEDVTELQALNDSLREEIAERRLAEEALRESEERYRTLFEGAPVGIGVTTIDGTIVAVNEELLQMLKASSRDEAFRTDVKSIYIDSEERAGLMERIVRDGFVHDYETRLQSLDGSIRDVLMTLNRFNYSGKEAILSVVQDITWKKQAEEETRHLKNYLANIIDSMPSILIGVDKTGLVTQWNKAAESETGISSDEAIGKYLGEVLPLLSQTMDRIREALFKNRPQTYPKMQSLMKGENRFIDMTIYPLVTNGAEGAVVRIDDITNRVRIEEMMIQSEKMLSVGGLAAGMAHEINNPLGIILAASQNILRRVSPDLSANVKVAEDCGIPLSAVHDYLEKRQVLTFLNDIKNGILRANQIVANMLSFSRRPDEIGSRENVADLMDQTLLLAASDYDLKKKYDFRQIEIIRKYDPSTPRLVCQASKIQQVFLNILRNDAEAMAENRNEGTSPRFLLRVLPDGNCVQVEIEDNGPGMDEAVRRRVFEPFFTTKPPGMGTGLGLSVSYFIITENHGGTISVESAPGSGTRFIVRLPAFKENAL